MGYSQCLQEGYVCAVIKLCDFFCDLSHKRLFVQYFANLEETRGIKCFPSHSGNSVFPSIFIH